MDLNLVNTDLINIEDVEFIQQLDHYFMEDRVYEIYRSVTKGNENLNRVDARKKLIRNIVLSKEAPMRKGLEYKRVFYYGNLMIQINLREKNICYLKNYKNIDFHYKEDIVKKNMLNEIMELCQSNIHIITI